MVVFVVGFSSLSAVTIYFMQSYIPSSNQNTVEEAYGIHITEGWQIRDLEERSPFLITYQEEAGNFDGKVIVTDGQATVYSIATGDPLPLASE